MGELLCSFLGLYVWVVIAYILLNWFRLPHDHPVGRLRTALGRIVEPLLTPIRKAVPPLRLGPGALDLSPIILIIGIQLIAGWVLRC